MSGQQTISQLLYAGAAIDPGATAVQDGDDRVTFDELMRRVESTGAALCRLVPGRDSRIAICAANHCDHLVAYLAVLVTGHVWVPLNPANGRAINSIIVDKADPDLVLVDSSSRGLVPRVDTVQDLGALRGEPDDFDPAHAAAGDLCLLYTSDAADDDYTV